MKGKKRAADGQRSARAAQARALGLIPRTGRVDDLIANVALAVGRPVHLLPFDLKPDQPTGFWIATDSANYVVHPSLALEAERSAIICHELAHMLLGHEPVGETARLVALAGLVAPDIDPEVAQRLLARHGYADDAEADAETLATKLVALLASRAEQAGMASDIVSQRLR